METATEKDIYTYLSKLMEVNASNDAATKSDVEEFLSYCLDAIENDSE